jgi:glycine C-acetyltransferase
MNSIEVNQFKNHIKKQLLHKESLTRSGALTQNLARFYPMSGVNMPERAKRLARYVESRIRAGVWPYRLKIIDTVEANLMVENENGERFDGVNFTTVDYLGLATHPKLLSVAHEALDKFGIHSCSSGPLLGNHRPSEQLRVATAEFVKCPYVFLFPNGWSSAFGAITSVVRKSDFVVIDELAHQSLQQASYASTDNVHKFPHLDNTAAEAVIREIRTKAPNSGILVVTEGLYSMDGDTPDFTGLINICRTYNAYLCVDVAHDLGTTGPEGTGSLGRQGVLDQVDIICGAYSKAFGAIGGFVATKHQGFHWHIGCFAGPYTYATALSPMSAAVANAAISLVRSPEGDLLREKLAANARRMRELCTNNGLVTLGSDSPIVPVIIGSESIARVAGTLGFERGLLCTVLEFPVVKQKQARFRLSMTPNHTESHMQKAVSVIMDAIQTAKQIVIDLRTQEQ